MSLGFCTKSHKNTWNQKETEEEIENIMAQKGQRLTGNEKYPWVGKGIATAKGENPIVTMYPTKIQNRHRKNCLQTWNWRTLPAFSSAKNKILKGKLLIPTIHQLKNL